MFEFEILTFLQGINDLEYKKPKEKNFNQGRRIAFRDESFESCRKVLPLWNTNPYYVTTCLSFGSSSQVKIIKAKLQSAQAVKLVAFTKNNVQSPRVGLGSLWCAAVMRGGCEVWPKKGLPVSANNWRSPMTQRLFTWSSEKWRSNFARHEILFHPTVTVVFKPPFSASDNDKEDVNLKDNMQRNLQRLAYILVCFSWLSLGKCEYYKRWSVATHVHLGYFWRIILK